MFSRRRFLQAGTVAAGASLAAFPSPLNAEENCAPLPPSIAALKSMKDLAKPITVEERAARQEKARQLMHADRMDALLLMEGTSLDYFTGVQWWGGERFFAVVLPVKGPALCVCPAFEEGRAREQLAASPQGKTADVRTWQEDQDPYALLAQGLKDAGLSAATLGMEETVRFVFSRGVAQAAPQLKIMSGTPVTAGCRRIKSDHELELMTLANKVTLTAYQAAYQALHDGMTQAGIERLIMAAYAQFGFPHAEVSINLDAGSSFPHGSTVPQIVREGTLVMVDDGCTVEGYQSDITRTFVFGKASDKMKKVFDIVHRAQAAALKTARPGLECQAVDASARKVITDSGYGPDYKFFTHRVGHGIGMDGHEWPYLVRGNTTLLARNMTFSDEPGIYIPGEFGIRLEDDMHITENGAELFTPQSPSLEDPFGTA
ncbi:MAG TPA: Xaa-Pro peptidase family protein [Terriglobales bacterium]|jgi:Xaa-Pro dipeptidase|nr:Xaa-Pro peptidase family protein [Terriglobales bacterium]